MVLVQLRAPEHRRPARAVGNPLGANKQKEYTTTLRVYLENKRSVGRTAQHLYLHRNTVAYRINRVLDVLGVDLDDPNQFLAVYLASSGIDTGRDRVRGTAGRSASRYRVVASSYLLLQRAAG
ncbi:helix-turn-helix domain-containing protein [Pseudonocardia bannensis]|uniref:PucR family transcriptional regulator n=1 Tax=Pseudonocardia bannensis TaxID=630973 RepID=A0A848DKW6_9PSEU|nr:helix-turn-helix domain-containing protein [Pseudonocardia bannensis]NMH93189.1 PucR family transcriptional regulator [Pseudonocardia bannensis]